MIEVKFIGRGGQGVATALRILAEANFAAGKFVQCFSSHGGERRGAAVEGYLRIDDKPIECRGHYMKPDVLVVFHPSLLNENVLSSLKEGAFILMNSAGEPSSGLPSSGSFGSARLNATAIAVSAGLGSPSSPILGPAMLGAICAFMPEIAPHKELFSAIRKIANGASQNSI